MGHPTSTPAAAQQDTPFRLTNASRAHPRVVPTERASSLHAFCAAIAELHVLLPGGQVHVAASWPSSSPRAEALEQRLATCATAELDGAARAGERARARRELHLRVDGTDLVASLVRHRASWFLSLFGESLRAERHERRIRLDAELRSYVAELPVRRANNIVARAMRLPSHGYTAVAEGAGLGFENGELLLASQNRLSVIAVRPVRGRLRARMVDSVDVPSALRPLFAGHETGSLSYFSPSDRGYYWLREHGPLLLLMRSEPHVLLLDRAHSSPCPPRTLPFERDCGILADGRTYFESNVLPREGFASSPHASSSFYGRFFGWVRRRNGTQQRVEVLVSRRGRMIASTVTAADTEGGQEHIRTVGASGYGAAFAAVDLDHDGALEVLTSSDAPVGEPDTLRLLRVSENGSLHQIWSSDPLEGSVLIAGVADIDQDGLPEFVAVEERGGSAYLWVVR